MRITIASIVDKDPDLATWAAKLTNADRHHLEAKFNDPMQQVEMLKEQIAIELHAIQIGDALELIVSRRISRMTTIPAIRPAGRVTNPRLFGLARRQCPGAAITIATLMEAARLTGEQLYVPGTGENVAAGIAEVQRERQRVSQSAAVARDYTKLGFDPTVDYRDASPWKE